MNFHQISIEHVECRFRILTAGRSEATVGLDGCGPKTFSRETSQTPAQAIAVARQYTKAAHLLVQRVLPKSRRQIRSPFEIDSDVAPVEDPRLMPERAMPRGDLLRSGRADYKYATAATLVFIALTACATSRPVPTPPVAPAAAVPLPIAQPSTPDVTPTSEDFATFWAHFREAALGDPRSFVKFTRFPFITNGETDNELERVHDEQSFLGVIDALLADDVGGPEPETHREYFLRNEVPPSNTVTGDQARVGNFVFFRIEGRWRLARGFLVE